MLYFFVSHAAGEDEYVRRFYRDLSAEVQRLVDVEGQVGFLGPASHQVRTGQPSEVDSAVGTCRVFIALCSPRYFRSDHCGREWSVFANRLHQHQAATGTVPPALIPVVWASADPANRSAGEHGPPALDPRSPGGAGLHRLVRLRSWRSTYLEFVSSLARRIVDTAEAHPIAPAAPGIEIATAANAFHPGEAEEVPACAGTADRHRESPTQQVHFVIAAGTRDEMGAVRNDVRFYGTDRHDWAPYRPALLEPLAERARSVAAERLLGSDVVDLDGLPGRIEDAHRNNHIVVLLVDAWATKLESYRSTLVEFDGRGETTVAVLVPTSREDAETGRHRSELRSEVSTTFRNTAARRDRMFRTEIETVGGFESDLMAALEAAQNRIYSKGQVFRRPAGSPPADRPILEGP